MKESKVHLVSAALEKNNSRQHFYTNHQLEFQEEQTSINHLLMNSFSQLDHSGKSLLHELQEQSVILNKLNKNHRYDYSNIKKILINFIQTSKESKYQLQKLGQTLQVIDGHLDSQSEFNKVANSRMENLEKATKKLQGSVNRQRNFLNNFAINQNNFFESIKDQSETHDSAKKNIQNVLEEQERFFTIISKNLEEQNLLHDLITKQYKEQMEFYNLFTEKQELSEKMDELILEKIKLQLTQQDDLYNYLEDNLK